MPSAVTSVRRGRPGSTALYKILMFLMFGVFVWIGAIVTVSRLGAAAQDAAYGLELDVVAVIIGGTAFQGARGACAGRPSASSSSPSSTMD